MFKTIIHSLDVNASQLSDLFVQPERCDWRKNQDTQVVQHEHPVNRDVLKRLREELRVDINPLPENFDPQAIKLFISDMDSTLIAIECIDEIADFINVKPEVAAITESAMAGEIDFATSLKKRVSLLKGLPQQQLQAVYDQRLRLNPGAERLIEGLKAKGIKTALVSGGFTFFSQRLQQRLQLDYQLANTLGIENGHLNGEVLGEIVTGERKANFLAELSQQLGISSKQAIAAGDGANDLTMLQLSGLGVAYHAKPLLQDKADIVINHGGLDRILELL